MEKHELLELFVTAYREAKSVKGDNLSPAVSRFKDVIKRLKQPPESLTLSVLHSVNVGKILYFFSDHKNSHIRSEWSLLCDHMMKILYAQGRESRRPVNSTPMGSMKKNGEYSKRDKEIPEKTKMSLMNKTGDSKRDKEIPVKTTMSLVNKTGDSKRDKVREILQSSLAKVANEVEDTKMKKRVIECDPSLVAVSVESAMFKKLGCFMGLQKAKYRSILFNIDDSNNPDLRRKVLIGEISGETLVMMKKEEMASEKIKEEVQKIQEKARAREEDRIKFQNI